MTRAVTGPREVLNGWRQAAERNRSALEDAKEARRLALVTRNRHIRELCDDAGLPQRDVAVAYGLSQPQVIRILASS